ncbi:type IV pilus twitching motility protein PilT [soil metagenome]
MGAQHLDALLAELVRLGGSDLHLRAGSPPWARVDGLLDVLPDHATLRAEDTDAILRGVLRRDLVDRFTAGIEVDFGYDSPGGGRFRVNAYRQRGTTALVLRQVVGRPATIEELGLPEVVRRFADEQRGLVLVAGPTGSGKTTTVAAMVDHVNRTRRAHVVTIEDPVEVLHTSELATISQREIGSDTPSFAAAVRSALRQDPDVVVVGEMRDRETVLAALVAAETGHLVLSTLHTTDATETINRIIELFPAEEQRQARLVLAGVLRGTVCQRLVRTADESGRVAAIEVLVVNGRVQEWILSPKGRDDVQDILAAGDYYGMQSFDQALLALCESGTIDARTALATASKPADLRIALERLHGAPPKRSAALS